MDCSNGTCSDCGGVFGFPNESIGTVTLESSGNVSLGIIRLAGTNGDATVLLDVIGGNATRGFDFAGSWPIQVKCWFGDDRRMSGSNSELSSVPHSVLSHQVIPQWRGQTTCLVSVCVFVDANILEVRVRLPLLPSYVRHTAVVASECHRRRTRMVVLSTKGQALRAPCRRVIVSVPRQ